MTRDTLKTGSELVELIDRTEGALSALISLSAKETTGRKERELDDGFYHLCVTEYGDGSGKKANLCRYFGNKRILDAIILELTTQLEEFEQMFADLGKDAE